MKLAEFIPQTESAVMSVPSIDHALEGIHQALIAMEDITKIRDILSKASERTPSAIKIAQIHSDNTKKRLNLFQLTDTIAVESYDDPSVALENAITDFLKRLWEAIKATFRAIGEALFKSVDNHSSNERYKNTLKFSKTTESHVKNLKTLDTAKIAETLSSVKVTDEDQRHFMSDFPYLTGTVKDQDLINDIARISKTGADIERVMTEFVRLQGNIKIITEGMVKNPGSGALNSDLLKIIRDYWSLFTATLRSPTHPNQLKELVARHDPADYTCIGEFSNNKIAYAYRKKTEHEADGTPKDSVGFTITVDTTDSDGSHGNINFNGFHMVRYMEQCHKSFEFFEKINESYKKTFNDMGKLTADVVNILDKAMMASSDDKQKELIKYAKFMTERMFTSSVDFEKLIKVMTDTLHDHGKLSDRIMKHFKFA
jgi:hypothetical protein